MVGHTAARRLFLLERGTGHKFRANTVYRVDPVSGRMDLDWSVTGQCHFDENSPSQALKVAGNGHLLLTLRDRIEEFDIDGNQIRVVEIDNDLSSKGFEFHMSLLLPDSKYHHSNFHNLLFADDRQAKKFSITQISKFAVGVSAIVTPGTCRLQGQRVECYRQARWPALFQNGIL